MNFPSLIFLTLVASMLVPDVTTLKRCSIVDATPDPTYHLIKPCSRSKMTLVGSANTKTLQQCQRYATGKKALALNYNPSGDFQEEPSCLLFDCPEFQEEISLAEDDVYDYFSLYASPMPDSNVSCVPKVGMFKLHREKANFTTAQEICEEEGGYLANVLSEQKTNALVDLMGSLYTGRGKHMVYVGLTDTEMEGQYVNMKDEPMDCFTWRAWAPNQPRSKHNTEDCVVLTTDKNWKVVNCTLQMPFLCELAPRGPYKLCEEEPAYCEPAGGSPTIPTESVETPSSQPVDHPDTDIPDIVEIPLPGASGMNSSDTDIEIMDIKNISESTTYKEQGGQNSGIIESQSNKEKEKILSSSNGSFENISIDFGSSNSMNNPKSNRTGNKWRPSLGLNGDSSNKNNSKPNNIKDSINRPDTNGWRPVSLKESNVNKNKKLPDQNNWSPQSMYNSGDKSPLWKPQKPEENIIPEKITEQGLWKPQNTDPDWTPSNGETSQQENNANGQPERPETQNNNQNIWRPHNSGDEHEIENFRGKPESFDSKSPQEENSWIPENVGSENPEQENSWRPHTPDENESLEEIYWNSNQENKSNQENVNFNQQHWGPQNTGTNNKYENNWTPNNGGSNGQRECNEWTPNRNRDPSDSTKPPWIPVDNSGDKKIWDCNLNKWVPQGRVPKVIEGENRNLKKGVEYSTEEMTDKPASDQNQPMNSNKPLNNPNFQTEYKDTGYQLNSDVTLQEYMNINTQQLRSNSSAEDEVIKLNDTNVYNKSINTRTEETTAEKHKPRQNTKQNVPLIGNLELNGYRGIKEFSTMEESKKSYRKVNGPMVTETLTNIKEDTGLTGNSTANRSNNTNQTREEGKVTIVVVKLRDPETRKCRAIKYDPN